MVRPGTSKIVLVTALVAVIVTASAYVFERVTDPPARDDAPKVSTVSTGSSTKAASSAPAPSSPSTRTVNTVGVSTAQYSSSSVKIFTPAKRGAGAVLTFDPKTAPVVPEGMTPDEYIAKYYEALIDGRWKTAFKMVPKNTSDETLKDFKALQYGYEVASFKVLGSWGDAKAHGALIVHITPTNGVWNTTWKFIRTKRGLAVQDLTYARPGGSGCH